MRPVPQHLPTEPLAVLNDKLIYAVLKNLPRTEFEKMVQQGADINCLNSRTNRTPLAYAVNENNYRAVRDLIDLGADPNVVMPGGHTALKIAILNPNYDGTEMARLLLSKGANHEGVKEEVGPANINVTVQYWLDQVTHSRTRARAARAHTHRCMLMRAILSHGRLPERTGPAHTDTVFSPCGGGGGERKAIGGGGRSRTCCGCGTPAASSTCPSSRWVMKDTELEKL